MVTEARLREATGLLVMSDEFCGGGQDRSARVQAAYDMVGRIAHILRDDTSDRDPGNGGRCGSRYPMTSDYAVIDEDANLLAYGFQRLPEAVECAERLESATYVIERQTVREIVWDLAHERGQHAVANGVANGG